MTSAVLDIEPVKGLTIVRKKLSSLTIDPANGVVLRKP